MRDDVWAALAWGAVSSAGLLVGATAGSFFRMQHRAIAMAMSIGAGAGALLAMTTETLIPEALHNSPRFSGLLAAVGFGLLLLVDATTR